MELGSPETWRWIWLAMAVALSVGELFVAGTFALLPFAAGAATAALLAFAGLPVAITWAAFVVDSIVMFVVLQRYAKRLGSGGHSGVGAERWVGRQAFVLQEIPRGHGATGLIRLEREEWRAESLTGDPIRPGSTVLVSRVDGTRLVVVPIDEPELDPGEPGLLKEN